MQHFVLYTTVCLWSFYTEECINYFGQKWTFFFKINKFQPSVWNKDFSIAAIPLEKQKSLLIKTRDPKISYGFGGHCYLCTLSGLCLFCNSNSMKPSFLGVFDELLLLYASSFSPTSVSSSHYCHHLISSVYSEIMA